MVNALQVHQRGTVTLPADIRQRYGIQAGDMLRLVDLEGVFILTPLTTVVADLASQMEAIRLELGLDTAELLATLREERVRYTDENYVTSSAS